MCTLGNADGIVRARPVMVAEQNLKLYYDLDFIYYFGTQNLKKFENILMENYFAHTHLCNADFPTNTIHHS